MALIEFITTFSVGIAASGNPCVVPLYPGFIAYLANKSQTLTGRKAESLLGLLVVLGVVTSMLAIGGVVTVARTSVVSVLRYATPAVDAFLIALGAILISGWQPWARLRPITVPRVSNPLLQAFLYGTLYGPITVPCNLPLLLSVVAFSLSSTELIEGIFIFLVFGLGFGVPLVVLSVAAKAQKDWLIRQLKSRYRQVNIVAGILLIGIGVYDLILISQFLKIFA